MAVGLETLVGELRCDVEVDVDGLERGGLNDVGRAFAEIVGTELEENLMEGSGVCTDLELGELVLRFGRVDDGAQESGVGEDVRLADNINKGGVLVN